MVDTDKDDALTAHIARALRDAKDASGLSFTQLSKATGLSRSVVELYIYGARSPRLRDFYALCGALGCNPRVLLDQAEAAVAQ